jgi:hypothetical protein
MNKNQYRGVVSHEQHKIEPNNNTRLEITNMKGLLPFSESIETFLHIASINN